MNSTPLVSVLMPVYNSEKYLMESITSILNQTFCDFEFIIINDGSTDNSGEILKKYEHADARIRIIEQPNKGIAEALNRGLQLARGKYIARMDSDDICLPNRFTRQVDFMERHPRVAACGTWIRYFGENEGEWQPPSDSETIRCTLLFESALPHPTVMMNRELLEQRGLQYCHRYEHAQDYALWVTISQHFELANIPEIHLHYRTHPGQSVQQFAPSKIKFSNQIRYEQLQRLGINPSYEEMTLFAAISMLNFHCSTQFIEDAERLFVRILKANALVSHYDSSTLLCVIQERWFFMCYTNTALGIWSLKAFQQSSLSEGLSLTWKQMTKFLLRCLIRR